MVSVGHDIRLKPGHVVLCAERYGSQLTATEAEDVAHRLLEAARIVRKANGRSDGHENGEGQG